MTTSNSIAPLIEIKDLCVRFQMPDHHVDAVQLVLLGTPSVKRVEPRRHDGQAFEIARRDL